MSETIVLKYVGNGDYIPGVPACNLTQVQIDESGFDKEHLLLFHSGNRHVYVEARLEDQPVETPAVTMEQPVEKTEAN
jgi:hypothetical protein